MFFVLTHANNDVVLSKINLVYKKKKHQQQNHQLSMFPYSSDKCGCIFLFVNQPIKIRTSMIVYTIQCPISVTILVYNICMWFCLSIYVKYTRMSMMYELVWHNMTCVIGIHSYYMLLYDIRDSTTMATSCHLWRQLVISSRHILASCRSRRNNVGRASTKGINKWFLTPGTEKNNRSIEGTCRSCGLPTPRISKPYQSPSSTVSGHPGSQVAQGSEEGQDEGEDPKANDAPLDHHLTKTSRRFRGYEKCWVKPWSTPKMLKKCGWHPRP